MSKTLGTIGLRPSRTWHGIYSATVVNSDDPLLQGRVKLQIPQVMGTAESNWADPLARVSNSSVPPAGTYLMATFIGGDVNKPAYLPGVWSLVGSGDVTSLSPSGDVTGAQDVLAINNALSGSSTVVTLMPGQWWINDTIQLPGMKKLAGYMFDTSTVAGTVITQVNGANLDSMIASTGWTTSANATSVFPSEVSGLYLNGNSANQTGGMGRGLTLQTFRSRVSDCVFINMLGDGIVIDPFGRNGTTLISNTAVENRIFRCEIRNSGAHGIVTKDTPTTGAKVTDGFIVDCIIQNSANDAIRIQEAAGWLISGNHCYSNAQSGIMVGRSFMTRITDNYVETWGSSATSGTYAAIDAGFSIPAADAGDASVIANNTCRFTSGPGNAGSTIYGIAFQANNGSNANVIISSNVLFASSGSPTAIVLKNQNSAATINYSADSANLILGANWAGGSAITLIANGGTITKLGV